MDQTGQTRQSAHLAKMVHRIRARYACKQTAAYDFEHVLGYDFNTSAYTPLGKMLEGITGEQQLQWVRECIRAVYALHYCGLLHRCITLDSFVVVSNTVYIADMHHCVSVRPANSTWRGTPIEHRVLCGAPELTDNQCTYSTEVDVWCLGRVLYRIMAGRDPDGEIDNDIHWNRWINDPAWQLYAIVIRSMLARDPNDRPTMHCTCKVLGITGTEVARQKIDVGVRVLWDETGSNINEFANRLASDSHLYVRDLILYWQLEYMKGTITSELPANVKSAININSSTLKKPQFWARVKVTVAMIKRYQSDHYKRIDKQTVMRLCAISEIIHNDLVEGDIAGCQAYTVYI